MKNKISRREWINRSATVIGGSVIGSMVGLSPLKGASLSKEPIRMMFNENPYGPSDIAKRAMRKAFTESNLYTMRAALTEFKELIAKLNGVKPENVAIGFGSREILNKTAIWTVTTAALQEVDRQLQAEKAKVATLESQVAALIAKYPL